MLGLTKLVRQGTFQPVVITAILLSSLGESVREDLLSNALPSPANLSAILRVTTFPLPSLHVCMCLATITST